MDFNIVEITTTEAQIGRLLNTGIAQTDLMLWLKTFKSKGTGVKGVYAYATDLAITSLTALGFTVAVLEDAASVTARLQDFDSYTDQDLSA